eukprot:5198047-Pyramimonas_sp.AAC.1
MRRCCSRELLATERRFLFVVPIPSSCHDPPAPHSPPFSPTTISTTTFWSVPLHPRGTLARVARRIQTTVRSIALPTLAPRWPRRQMAPKSLRRNAMAEVAVTTSVRTRRDAHRP